MSGIDAPLAVGTHAFRMVLSKTRGPLMFKANQFLYVVYDDSLDGKRGPRLSPYETQRTGIRKEMFRTYV